MHTPKTGGSTLVHVLKRRFHKSQTLSIYPPVRELDYLQDLNREELSNLQLLHGHIEYGVHKLLQQPCDYITMLREPVSRLISHYYHVLADQDHYLHDEVIQSKMNLKDYVKSGISNELDNGQIRLLSGTYHNEFGSITDKELQIAKTNISEHFVDVGITDKFDETLFVLKHSLGWKSVPYYIKWRVSKNKPEYKDIPKSTIVAIEKSNELDCELYEYASNILDKKIKELNIECDVRNYRNMNRYYSSLGKPYMVMREVARNFERIIRG